MLLAGELDILLRRAYEEQERTSGQRVVAEAQRILEERYRESITMSALAAEIGVSRSSLYAHFVRVHGQTPPGYRLEIRLRRALGLLHHSDMTLDAIADSCGFHSASHLSRHVKAAIGFSPGALRKGALGDVGIGAELIGPRCE
jgi:AraC-like DNA-binding protein